MNTANHRSMERRLQAAAETCERHGAQLTELRRMVLSLVLEADGPLTAYQLLDRLKERRKSAVPPTIYRGLDFLVKHGLIHKIERLNAFIPCADAEHDHHDVQFLICQSCGTVAEIEDRMVRRALAGAAARQGFQPQNAVVELNGTCALCAAHPPVA